MERDDGYYWVKVMRKWEVAQWDGTRWWALGVGKAMADSTFEEIDERRLVLPAKEKN